MLKAGHIVYDGEIWFESGIMQGEFYGIIITTRSRRVYILDSPRLPWHTKINASRCHVMEVEI